MLLLCILSFFLFVFCLSFFFFFFFQAEDGIRDHCVTGVQTCALPISVLGRPRTVSKFSIFARGAKRSAATFPSVAFVRNRSEERRVGKECRYRWAPYH